MKAEISYLVQYRPHPYDSKMASQGADIGFFTDRAGGDQHALRADTKCSCTAFCGNNRCDGYKRANTIEFRASRARSGSGRMNSGRQIPDNGCRPRKPANRLALDFQFQRHCGPTQRN